MKYDVSLQTIAWLKARQQDHSLEISPKFQRRPVWMEKERSSLLGTVLSGLPFPEIYIHHDTDPDSGTERHIVVDGQQRVTSLLMFTDGDLQLPDDESWNGKSFSDLSSDQKKSFWNYKIVVRSLSETNDAEIRDLFERLNTNNIALNDQEIRNAHYMGAFKKLAERMADNAIFQTLGLFTARDIRRMLDVEFASELLLINVVGITNKKDMLDSAYANFEEELPREAEYEEEFSTALSLLRSIVSSENKSQIKKKSNFYTLYGCCLKYFRGTGRAAFHRADQVSGEVTRVISVTSLEEARVQPAYIRDYFDAVTRAASDKGRRVERETILYEVITSADDGLLKSQEEQMPLTGLSEADELS